MARSAVFVVRENAAGEWSEVRRKESVEMRSERIDGGKDSLRKLRATIMTLVKNDPIRHTAPVLSPEMKTLARAAVRETQEARGSADVLQKWMNDPGDPSDAGELSRAIDAVLKKEA